MKKITLLMLALTASISMNAQIDTAELLQRFELHKNSPGSIFEFFSAEELSVLREEIAGAYVSTNENRGTSTFAVAWESQGLGYGNFDITTPDPYTNVSIGSNTPDFEAAGTVDPTNNAVAYAADNAGQMYSIDVATGVYTFLGNTGISDTTGLEFDLTSGILYMTTTTDLYSIDLAGPTATLIGPIGTDGGVAIALAIDGNGDAYTYDITDDLFYSIDLGTGAGTAIGSIGFDASFGQGMFYDQNSDQVIMASLNAGTGNLGELRSVDVSTGTTTLIGEWNPGVVSQVAWASPQFLTLSTQSNILLNNISLSPNPTDGDIRISIAKDFGTTAIDIINLNGQSVLKTTIDGITSNTINTSNFAAGIYFAKVSNDSGSATIKFIKK